MKNYELLCVIKPNLDIDGVEQVVKNLEEAIKNYGGTVSNIDKLGRKKLAYEIDTFRDGFYVVANIELPEEKVVELRRYIKLNENFLRELVTVQSTQKAAAAK